MADSQRMVGRRTLIALIVATIAVPVVFGLLSIFLGNPYYIISALPVTIVLAVAWYAAEVGHRKSAHPSRTPGATAKPRPDGDA